MDSYLGGGEWHFDNAAFIAAMVGGTIVIAGSPTAALNDTYTIASRVSATNVVMTPSPASGATGIDAVSITLTYTPAVQFLAGPKIAGVTLIQQVKEGANKLPSSRRAT